MSKTKSVSDGGRTSTTQQLPCPYCSPFRCVHSAEEQRSMFFEETAFTQDPDIAFTVFRGPGKIYRTMQGCVNGHAKVKRVATKPESASSPNVPSESIAPAPSGATNMGIGRMTSLSWRPKMEPTAAEIAEKKKLNRLNHLRLEHPVTTPEMMAVFGVVDNETFKRFLDLRDEQGSMSRAEFKQSGKWKEMQSLVKRISTQGNRAVYPKGPIERWNLHQWIDGAEEEDGSEKTSKRIAEDLHMKKEGVEAIQHMNGVRRQQQLEEQERLEREEEERAFLESSAVQMESSGSLEGSQEGENRRISFDDSLSAAPGEMLATVMQLVPGSSVSAEGEEGDAVDTSPPPPEEIPGTLANLYHEAKNEAHRRQRYFQGHGGMLPQSSAATTTNNNNDGEADTAQPPPSVGGANSGPGGPPRPLSPEQTIGTVASHGTSKQSAAARTVSERPSSSQRGADEPQQPSTVGPSESVSSVGEFVEERRRSLTPKEALMEKLSKCNLCRMQKVFCHRCKRDLSRYYQGLGGVPKPELQYEATLRRGMTQDMDTEGLMDMLLTASYGKTSAENPPPWDILKDDLHSLITRMEALQKSQMEFLQHAQDESQDARATFKHRNFVVNVVERHVAVHPDLKSIGWTKRVLDRVPKEHTTRSGVGLNSISPAYSARALDGRLKRTKREAQAAAQREGIELPGSGWHTNTSPSKRGADSSDGKDKPTRGLTGKYAGKRTLPKVQPHLAKGRRPAGIPGPT